MKKCIAVILCLVLFVCMCGCKASDTDIKQEMTIVTMPSPPKCKTTDKTNVINNVLSIIEDMEKTPFTDKINGWRVMIKLNVDGQILSYTLSERVFTDSDGTQYLVDGTKAIAEILDIYKKLDAPEKEYT